VTGPGHYLEAEKCIGWAEGEHDRDKRTSLQARAQVHATLALAAATIQQDNTGLAGDWAEVVS